MFRLPYQVASRLSSCQASSTEREAGSIPGSNGLAFGPLAQRLERDELLDAGGHDANELRGTFRDMRRVNRLLGGSAITVRGIQRLTGHLRPNDELSVLDIGAGHADIPRTVAEWARRRGLTCRTIALDIDFATLATAIDAPENRSVEFVTGDGLNLPMPDNSVDIAMSSMTLHHFSDDDAVEALREMARVARLGLVVNDLLRTLHGYAIAWLLARTATRNRLTRHDAHLSILRSRRIDELEQLAFQAGLQKPVFDSTLGYRTAMTIGVRRW